MALSGWSAYLGLPQADHGRGRDGVDCWGLVHLVFAQELGIALPSYAGGYADTGELAEIAALVEAGRSAGPWRPVDRPRAYDVHLFRIGRWRAHVGLAVDARRMLHIHGRAASCIVPLTHPLWASRHEGTYRHEALA